MSFKVGDRVVIVKSPRPERIGAVCNIVGASVRLASHEYRNPGPWKFLPKGTPMFRLDLPPVERNHVAYPASHLELYSDDSAEKCEWTDELRRLCKPEKVSA